MHLTINTRSKCQLDDVAWPLPSVGSGWMGAAGPGRIRIGPMPLDAHSDSLKSMGGVKRAVRGE
jgi:hypothetical protein